MGGGKGAFYKAKYGGGGKGGKGSKGGNTGGVAQGDVGAANEGVERPWSKEDTRAATHLELNQRLHELDGRAYPAYRDVEGFSYQFDQGFSLVLDRAQTDPFAPPSQMRICSSKTLSNFTFVGLETKVRRIALADLLARKFWEAVHERGLDEVKQSSNYHGEKGGQLNIERPTQHVLERSSAVVFPTGEVEVRFVLSLPGVGRSILGARCADLMCVTLPNIVIRTLTPNALNAEEVLAHVNSVEDQECLRQQLHGLGLIGFVRNGAILPRRSGDDDRPLAAGAVPFQSPPSLEVEVKVPHRGVLRGMGVKPGVTLIVGGGFHGKSTLLSALQTGVYNKIPGDGREFVCVVEDAVKVRAEDKRSVASVNISCFLNNLPMGKSTVDFSTQDASGSTSQASNIMEALELGTRAVLIDEDTCATNFMIRDYRMQLLVHKDKEPITPFILKVRQMASELNTSTICVVGGAGAYLEVADTVIMMDSYEPKDVTDQAKTIVAKVCPPPHFPHTHPHTTGAERANCGRQAPRVWRDVRHDHTPRSGPQRR